MLNCCRKQDNLLFASLPVVSLALDLKESSFSYGGCGSLVLTIHSGLSSVSPHTVYRKRQNLDFLDSLTARVWMWSIFRQSGGSVKDLEGRSEVEMLLDPSKIFASNINMENLRSSVDFQWMSCSDTSSMRGSTRCRSFRQGVALELPLLVTGAAGAETASSQWILTKSQWLTQMCLESSSFSLVDQFSAIFLEVVIFSY